MRRLLAALSFLACTPSYGLAWGEFERRYLSGLRNATLSREDFAALIVLLNAEKDVTLLCIESSPDRCHRRLLAEECRRILPPTEMHIR